eukprot:TRINITY_DN598_c0_g2_i1.p1 TRINITY_DN598_c0_g2~~TRINITY_DN598_c0_g2_i1.p1  ORF type:complete len:309 (+),score=-20.06 TRINITY_DN598_c0_g2_i1:62-988(+)
MKPSKYQPLDAGKSEPIGIIDEGDMEMDYVPAILSPEDAQLVQKRCERCGIFYTEATNGECFYHPGEFDEPRGKSGALVGWSCCRVLETNKQMLFIPAGTFTVLKEESLKKDGRGCRRAEKHIEDTLYSKATARFPFKKENLSAGPLAGRTITPGGTTPHTPAHGPTPSAPPLTPSAPPDEAFDETMYFKHVKEEGDTLLGLAIRYDIDVGELKRINRLFSDQMFQLSKFILIPKEKEALPMKDKKLEDKNSLLLSKFKRRTGCDLATAKYYLSMTEYKFDEALKEWNDDIAFEKSSGKSFPPKPVSK